MSDLTQFDSTYLCDDGPAGLVIREWLMPVEASEGVLFPATFAAGDGFPGGYNIDGDPNGENVCLIDSVGSQANRIEPLFKQEKYCHLVPQVVVKAGEKEVNLLDAGHRAGDAIVRCSELQQALQDAFKELLKGNADSLARIAPTSLVFGVWDSRDTQAKLPRLVASTIRAFNVRRLTRGAVYLPPIAYVDEGLIDPELDKGSGKENPLSVKGFKHNPASATHGGVIAKGGIRRDATLGLAALRLLAVGKNEEKTRALRRYVLGLSLVAFTAHNGSYLRQGCLLVRNPDKAKENQCVEVYSTGERKPVTLSPESTLEYATVTAQAFGVGVDFEKLFETREQIIVARHKREALPDVITVEVPFDKNRALNDIKGNGDAKGKGKKGKVKDLKAGPEGDK